MKEFIVGNFYQKTNRDIKKLLMKNILLDIDRFEYIGGDINNNEIIIQSLNAMFAKLGKINSRLNKLIKNDLKCNNIEQLFRILEMDQRYGFDAYIIQFENQNINNSNDRSINFVIDRNNHLIIYEKVNNQNLGGNYFNRTLISKDTDIIYKFISNFFNIISSIKIVGNSFKLYNFNNLNEEEKKSLLFTYIVSKEEIENLEFYSNEKYLILKNYNEIVYLRKILGPINFSRLFYFDFNISSTDELLEILNLDSSIFKGYRNYLFNNVMEININLGKTLKLKIDGNILEITNNNDILDFLNGIYGLIDILELKNKSITDYLINFKDNDIYETEK